MPAVVSAVLSEEIPGTVAAATWLESPAAP